jgi:hypothetical protein
MYADKDNAGNISIMEMSVEEAKELGAMLFDYECIINNSNTSDSEKAQHLMSSQKIRFMIIDAIKIEP